MVDREKIIKGLETCSIKTGALRCLECPYTKEERNTDKWCTRGLHRDILALLKEQESKIGHWIDSAGNDKCSVCGATYSDLYPDYQNTHYCPNCGAKMTKSGEVR